jgi:hypothetical protein
MDNLIMPIKSTGKEVLSQLSDESLDIIYLYRDRIIKNIIEDIEVAKMKIKVVVI